MSKQYKVCYAAMLALSLSVMTCSGYAVVPINTNHNGQIIQGGTYFNTPGDATVFRNTAGTGLWLKSGTTVRGVEVFDSSGNLTNNGGAIKLNAPGSVVRVDGDINVNGVLNGQGSYLGNGGKLSINSTYLFQSGNIYAMGANGGHVTFNVNSATIGPNAKIDASAGPSGFGGTIRIHATGVVDIKNSALLNMSGVPMPGVDSNVIQIIGGLVNNAGIIQANGIDNPLLVNGHDASTGGIIRLVAKGNTNLDSVTTALNHSNLFTQTERNTITTNNQALVSSADGSMQNLGIISANGGKHPQGDSFSGGDGGKIILKAVQNISNTGGAITANGGDGFAPEGSQRPIHGGQGGIITLLSGSQINNQSTVLANGGIAGAISPTPAISGNGGFITFKTGSLNNQGNIWALGGLGNFGGNFIGGKGGTIALYNSGCSHLSQNSGIIAVTGGGSFSNGGVGGTIIDTNLTNNNILDAGGDDAGSGGHIINFNLVNAQTGIVRADGGQGGGFNIGNLGGNGGTITNIHTFNAGRMEANGSIGANILRGVLSFGGKGGKIINTNVTNTGNMEVNGGSSTGDSGTNAPGADGGTIINTRVTNSGTMQADSGGGPGIGDGFAYGGTGGRIINNYVINTGLIHANGNTGGSFFADNAPSNIVFGGTGGQITNTHVLNNGTIQANGGDSLFKESIGGTGGKITNRDVTNNGLLQTNGGTAFNVNEQINNIGGQGGVIVFSHSINNKNGQIESDGGTGLIGGAGGSVQLSSMTNKGVIDSNGGIGTDAGGQGGTIKMNASLNQGILEANGASSTTGSMGGTIALSNITNNGIVRVNGGNSAGNLIKGGQGGKVTANTIINNGTVQANGGQGGPSGNGGDGGSIMGKNVTNHGVAQALGGQGGTGGASGTNGTVTGF